MTESEPQAHHNTSGASKQRLLVILLAVASLATTALIVINVVVPRGGGPAPGVLLKVPAFTLTERSGQSVSLDDLGGKVWIADFVFTNCAGPCPIMTARMAQFQEDLSRHPQWDRIRLVTITVDPARDTPPVLRQYADRFGADAEHWLFLTGRQEQVWPLVAEGFKLAVGENPNATGMPIIHSQKFVLVDAAGRIRGYYDALEPEGQAALMRDLDRLLEQE